MQEALKTMQIRDANRSLAPKSDKTRSSLRARASRLCLLILVALSLRVKISESLRFSSIQIPALVQRGSNFALACLYELEPSEQLYSVKWYKGNEEFYKLQATNNNQLQQPPISAQYQYQRLQQDAQVEPSGQQQQYFSQAGVNVRMSLSNATHVHMLNASLESEGVYACEISTQNLSTIRYEKEIRLYVLPQTRLNVNGFKQRYAIDERVELTCASDFTRPRAALAWFANGQRISSKSKPSLFELESSTQTRSMDKDNQVVKVILALRFRLTSELLATYASHADRSRTNETRPAHQLQAGQSLKLQCKFRLAEVSDVAFNELKLTAATDKTIGAFKSANKELNLGSLRGKRRVANHLHRARAIPTSNLIDAPRSPLALNLEKPVSEGAGPKSRFVQFGAESEPETGGSDAIANNRSLLIGNGPETGQIRRKRRRTRLGSGAGLLKSSQENRVIQSASDISELKRLFGANFANTNMNAAASNCASGALALQPDDPVILVRTPESSGSSGARAGAWPNEQAGRRRRKRQLDLNLSGENNSSSNNNQAAESAESDDASDIDELNVDCMTIGAILQQQHQTGDLAMALQVGPEEIDNDGDNEMISLAQINYNAAHRKHKYHAQQQHKDTQFCSDESTRRRWAISGKSSYNEQPSALDTQLASSSRLAASNHTNTWLWPANQRVSYVNISSHSHNNRLRNQPRQKRQLQRIVKDQFKVVQDAIDSDVQHANSRQIVAPPLLEWFINNHEAPTSSVNYQPELPMLATTSTSSAANATPGSELNQNSQEDQLDGATTISYIDYAEYFANFDSKPTEQKLNLKLNLEKKHFSTPDSKLTLRCSSTQAQILWLDSVDLKIVLINSEHSIADHLQSSTNSWQKRKVPNHQNAGYYNQQTLLAKNNYNSNQAKLLHQQQSKSGASNMEPSINISISIILFAVVLLL